MKNRFEKVLTVIDDNAVYIMGTIIGVLSGALIVTSIKSRFQTEMFAQVENAVKELGLTEQVINHMKNTPVKKLT